MIVSEDVRTYRRRLPHYERKGATYFVTFRLRRDVVRGCTLREAERAFVRDTILAFHPAPWHVQMLTVMPDHVHILCAPVAGSENRPAPLTATLRLIKGRTAFMLNKVRQRNGQFWQDESFDRVVRDEREHTETARYILHNAVRAELVENGWDYDGFWCNEHDGIPGD